jgi:hypothetical protein
MEVLPNHLIDGSAQVTRVGWIAVAIDQAGIEVGESCWDCLIEAREEVALGTQLLDPGQGVVQQAFGVSWTAHSIMAGVSRAMARHRYSLAGRVAITGRLRHRSGPHVTRASVGQ